MDEHKLLHYQAKLLALQAEVRAAVDQSKASAQTVELDQNRVGRLSRMDALQGQAMAQASNQRQTRFLLGVDAALDRVDAGEYGVCLECDQLIASGRLELDPTAELCIECASKLEA